MKLFFIPVFTQKPDIQTYHRSLSLFFYAVRITLKYSRRHLQACLAKLQVGEDFLPRLKEAKESHELKWKRFPQKGENQQFSCEVLITGR